MPDSGDNSAWTLQAQSHNKDFHGSEVLLFFDYMFLFDGVSAEKLTENPKNHGSAAQRFVYTEDGVGGNLAQVLTSSQATGTSFVRSRSYYSMLRLNGFLWVLAGNNGNGPITAIERTPN